MENILYIVLAVVGLFIFMQIFARLSTYFKKGKVIEGVSGKLGRELDSGKRLLVYFYSNGCAACKPMTPLIDKLKKEFSNIHKINVASDMETGRIFGIMGTPATVVVEDKKIQQYELGAKNEVLLRKMLG